MSDSVGRHRQQPTRLPRPWDFPGKNTGVGCHFLLQWMKVKSESEVPQLCPTLCDPMDCSLPGSSARGIFQARVLEWVAIAFSNGGMAKHLWIPLSKKKKKSKGRYKQAGTLFRVPKSALISYCCITNYHKLSNLEHFCYYLTLSLKDIYCVQSSLPPSR